MNSYCWPVLPWFVTVPCAWAQKDPHVGYVYPAGGRQGTTFQVTIGGSALNNTTAVFVSGAGVSTKVIKEDRQVTPAEQKEMRESLDKIQEKRKKGLRVTSEEAKKAEEIKQKLTNFGRRLTNPSLGEFITLQVTMSRTAAPGDREIRVMTSAGLSNPLLFVVGDLPESSKKDWKDVPKSRFSMEPELDPKPPEKNITLPVTLNGQIPPGGLDRYRFQAREGQSWVVAVRARDLIPYIPDAVPGWLQAIISVRDGKGRELAPMDDSRLHFDPTLFYKIPASDEYVIEIRDALYRGREDFVYRVSIDERPFVTGIFPLGGRTGTQTNIAVTGWNLPFKQLPLNLRDKSQGIHPLMPDRFASGVSVSADSLPEVFESEPNNTAGGAQPVSFPTIINGRIDPPGDVDTFRFEGKAGDQIVAEINARRLGSPLDSVLSITDGTGRQIASNDDHEDKGAGLNTHHADSYLALTLPAAGSYFVQIRDAQRGGGALHSYRLRLSLPQPDFELRVTPSALNVHGGASVPVTVHALRKDGYAGPISLRLKDAPKGFSLSGAEVPGKQDKARFTLNAPSTAMTPFSLRLEGYATIQGREIRHFALPADDVMQSFSYRHLVAAKDLKVAVIGRFRAGDASQVLSTLPVRIPVGGTARVRVGLPAGPLVGKIEFELSEPPDGISIKDASPTEISLQADAAKVKPGSKGNLIIKASAEPPAAAGTQTAPANRRRISLGALPAIPYEIVSQ